MSVLSLGEQMIAAIVSEFENGLTKEIKAHSAALINLVDSLKAKNPELAALAQQAIVQAAQYALKAAAPAVVAAAS